MVERLTEKRDGQWVIPLRKDGKRRWSLFEYGGAAASYLYGDHANRLAAYEDTMPLERAQELAQAEKDGRLVVLPCKVGDKVKVDVNSWGNVWNYKTYDFGRFLHGEIVSISITKKQFLIKIRVNHNVYWKRPMKRYPISALGKTVFLTQDEAEAALKKREEAE